MPRQEMRQAETLAAVALRGAVRKQLTDLTHIWKLLPGRRQTAQNDELKLFFGYKRLCNWATCHGLCDLGVITARCAKN
jgi:hypothetical protein